MVTLEQFRYLPTHATRPPTCFDFHYAEPGMVAIFGDNGSGKSTLAQLMAGWYPDFLPGEIEGKGTLLGNPIGQLSLVEQASTVQLVQQSPISSFPAVHSASKKRPLLVLKISASAKTRLCVVLMKR